MPDLSTHHMLTIYNDPADQSFSEMISEILPEKDMRILLPKDESALLQAAQNSSLVIIILQNEKDYDVNLAKRLKDDRMVVADILAVMQSEDREALFSILSKGYDGSFTISQCEDPLFKKILKRRMAQGSKRLAGFILEEEYRRFSDALSCAPTSVMVFDREKRIVFVSEHYYRAYPVSAPRLIRGISVYEAFEMMSKEEKISENDPRYDEIRSFWYNLSGDVEFTLDNGISYRLKATMLPNDRGTIVTAQNITEYVKKNDELQKALKRIKD